MSDNRGRDRPEGSWSQSHESRLVPNVKPKLYQKERSSREEPVKRERTVKVRRSRSTDSDRRDRGRRRERERHHGEWRRRGRSEEARGRDRREGERDHQKGHPPEDDVDDIECAICFCSYDNIFKTPKLLACGHTFCLECLARINVTSAEIKALSCPVCREVTEIPHGQDLPRLGNNEDIIGKLPPEMQRALSIRFKRSKGKLVLKSPPPTSPTKSNVLTLPTKSPGEQATERNHLTLSAVEQGVVTATVVDVGRPPNRISGGLRRMFRSERCYYAVVATIITVTVALMLVGILAFAIIPNVVVHRWPDHSGNQTGHGPPGHDDDLTEP